MSLGDVASEAIHDGVYGVDLRCSSEAPVAQTASFTASRSSPLAVIPPPKRPPRHGRTATEILTGNRPSFSRRTTHGERYHRPRQYAAPRGQKSIRSDR